MDFLPIDPDIILKRMAIPEKLAELSYIKPDTAIELLRIWGEKRMPITPMYDLVMSHLKEENENGKPTK